MKKYLAYLLLFIMLQSSSELIAQNMQQYINPIPLDAIPFINSRDSNKGHRSVADPEVAYYNSKYYMAATGEGDAKRLFWISEDLVRWTYKQPSVPDGTNFVARSLLEFDGYFYLTGNGTRLYRSKDIMGPYVNYGHFKRPRRNEVKVLKMFDNIKNK